MAGTLRGSVHSQGPRLLLPACASMMLPLRIVLRMRESKGLRA